jgi:hypothetical protein
MPVLIANPTARRKEEAIRTQARLAALEAGVDRLVEQTREVAAKPSSPTFTSEDAWDLSLTLAARGTDGLPHGSHVETQAVDTTSPLQRPYGRVYTTAATSTRLGTLPHRL